MKGKKVGIIAGSILLIVALGAYAVDQIVVRNIDKVVPKETVQELNKLVEELQKESGGDLQKAAEQMAGEAENQPEKSQSNQQANQQGQVKQQAENNPKEQADSQPANGNKSNKVEEAKKQIPLADQAKGMAIAGKLDVGYLSSLSKGGLTAEEKKEVKQHITSRLSSGEIQEMIRLYNQYSNLIK